MGKPTASMEYGIMNRRKIIYTIELTMTDGSIDYILLATYDKHLIEELIEKNRMFLEMPKVAVNGSLRSGVKIQRFRISEEKLPFNWSIEEYENIVASCDIIEEDDDVLTPFNGPRISSI